MQHLASRYWYMMTWWTSPVHACDSVCHLSRIEPGCCLSPLGCLNLVCGEEILFQDSSDVLIHKKPNQQNSLYNLVTFSLIYLTSFQFISSYWSLLGTVGLSNWVWPGSSLSQLPKDSMCACRFSFHFPLCWWRQWLMRKSSRFTELSGNKLTRGG